MNEFYLKQIENLNNADINERLNSLSTIIEGIKKGDVKEPAAGNDVNNHIHTWYSFSPYSPTKAVYMAYVNGLKTAGIMDHDTLAGTREFIKAGEIVGIATTIGVELRVSMDNTPLKGMKINNPDQNSIVYMAMHGIPHSQIDMIQDYVSPYREKRNIRNQQMVSKLNELTSDYGIELDFENDVIPLSKWNEGGSVTERHISYALAIKMVEKFGKGDLLVDLYKNKMGLPLSAKNEGLLLDDNNCVYEYDLLGAIKSDMIDKFYINATDECPDVQEALSICEKAGAISAYAYLGDIGDSVTGDKKPQKFEDAYLEDLFKILKKLRFNAVTYMPSRNTIDQLNRVKMLCDYHELFQISGEDINSPRQKFICDAMRNPVFGNLQDSTWALIGHEKQASMNINYGMFSESVMEEIPDLYDRIELYKKRGLSR
ncbi:MAG: PHP domain-containing protein [Clostridia bacterium]|nr:PHP domain-containing protein [Clostridia bacterium]